jgi:hypothetical protein
VISESHSTLLQKLTDSLCRIWLKRLHDVAFPTFYAFGHVSALLTNSIPEYQKVKQILSGWICHRFYSLRPYYRDGIEDKFLAEVINAAALAFAFDRDNATHYIRRADCIVLHRPPILVYENRGYLVHDLINFLEAESASETLPESSIIRGASFIKCVVHFSCVIGTSSGAGTFWTGVSRSTSMHF